MSSKEEGSLRSNSGVKQKHDTSQQSSIRTRSKGKLNMVIRFIC